MENLGEEMEKGTSLGHTLSADHGGRAQGSWSAVERKWRGNGVPWRGNGERTLAKNAVAQGSWSAVE